MSNRPSWDEYFMGICYLLAKRSSCLSRQFGAVLVKDKRILATGYNGAPRGIDNCVKKGFCIRRKLNIPSGERAELCKAVHAEENAILQCAYHGIKAKGSTIYIPATPCSYCTKSIIQVGIKEIVYVENNIYPDKLAIELREESNIILRSIKYEVSK